MDRANGKGKNKCWLVGITRYHDPTFANYIREAAAAEGLSISSFQRKAVIQYLKRTFGEEKVNAMGDVEEQKAGRRRRPRRKGVLAQIRAMRDAGAFNIR